MSITTAYISVILIWSTTPLAIKWSIEGTGFLFGVVSRMGIGMVIAILLCALMRVRLPRERNAYIACIVSGTGSYLALLLTYQGAQFIPSGWVSVIFAVSPIITSMLASIWLKENSTGLMKTSALFFSITGLYIMFHEGTIPDDQAYIGISLVMSGAVFYSLSLVGIKIIDAQIRPVAMMTGTLIIAELLFILTWLVSGNELPGTIPVKAAGAILYLSVIGSVVGFMLFFYVLQHISATRAALITMITPVCALVLGYVLNREPLTAGICLGAAMVICGLLLFEFGDAILLLLGRKPLHEVTTSITEARDNT